MVFSDSSKRKFLEYDTSNDNILHFAGTDEEYLVDGLSLKCPFKESCSREVIFITDTINTFIVMIISIKNSVSFLKAVREIYEAFSVHEKRKEFTTYTPDEKTSNKVKKCKDFLKIIQQASKKRPEQHRVDLKDKMEMCHVQHLLSPFAGWNGG